MDCRLEFVPFGSVLDSVKGKVALDVGNRLTFGVIDHHQPGEEAECATSLILRHPDYVLSHLQGIPKEEVTLITHVCPDLDAMTAVFFCRELLRTGRPPALAEVIADYVRDVDRGLSFRRPHSVVTIHSIYLALCELTRREEAAKGWPKEETYRRQVEEGMSLWEYVISVADGRTSLHEADLFGGPHPFGPARDLIVNDHRLYLEDLASATVEGMSLPRQDGGPPGSVDALFIADPRSLLFRSWARSDTLHSPRGQGFPLLLVNYGDKRFVISVDPCTAYYLKGLGDLLEEAESDKRRKLGRERTGKPRPGYGSPDPWYDGRGPLHHYTIVDTPAGGTVLTWEEVIALVHKFSRTFSGVALIHSP